MTSVTPRVFFEERTRADEPFHRGATADALGARALGLLAAPVAP